MSSSMENTTDNLKEERFNFPHDDEDEPVPNYRGIKAMPYIIGNETFEKLGTVGSATNLVVYLTTVFNMRSVTAATLINVFNGTCNLATLVGAFLCDSYFGRYKCLGFASVFSLLGMLILMLTAAIPTAHPPHCAATTAEATTTACSPPTPWQFTLLLTSFLCLVIGAGGIRPCNLAFGADQFDPRSESGKRGTSSFFNWYYCTYAAAVMVSVTVIVYVQSNISWSIGLAIPASLMFISCALFFWGTSIYVIVKPHGSPLTNVAQVLVAALRKRSLELPEDGAALLFRYLPRKTINSRLPHTTQFRCLDKAAIVTDGDQINRNGSPNQPWRLCSMQQVEEVKCIVRILPIWASTIIFNVPLLQQQTYAVFQALQSDRQLGHFQVPAATYVLFTMLTLTIWIPIYDRLLVPYLEKTTRHKGGGGGLTLLQRMGIGMVLAIVCALVSGVVEMERKHVARVSPTLGVASQGGEVSAMSSMWLVPQLVLAGLAEAFGYIAQIEFFYKQFPENMRSIAQSFFFVAYALSNYLSGFLVSAVHKVSDGSKGGDWLADDLNKGKLDWFYFVMGGLGVVNFGYFLVCARWYTYKDDLKRLGGEIDLDV